MTRLLVVSVIVLAGIITAVATQRNLSAGALTVVSTTPSARSLAAPVDTAVTIQFSQPISRSTILSSTVRVFGQWSGAKPGTFGFADLDQTVIFTPTTSFSAGEVVMVILSGQIRAADGSALANSHTVTFWTESQPATLQFQHADTLDVRGTAGVHTQAYGGVATDFNNDGWLDLTIINEITADARVFLNRADGSGLYNDFLLPTTPLNTQASPSAPSDFNLDGNADLAVVNIGTNSISILLGNGDGTFASQEVSVGPQPRGIAVLDVDSDGDPDIVNTNSGFDSNAGNLSILLNDGQGVFGPPTYFEGGGTREWALAAADMDEDGILDLVIGTRATSNPQVIVNKGNGDGTFTFVSARIGGQVWMLNVGDVNGDGHEDVATANSNNSTGSIFLGDGAGNLSAPMYYPIDPFPLATDLGDIDGDGDLDWATSSFSGDWHLFLNNGDGVFTLRQTFPATSASSCALMMDMNNDGTLDLALIDEIADEVQLMHNPPAPVIVITPTISITPTFISTTLAMDTAVTLPLTIANTGTGPLNWTISESFCTIPAEISWLQVTPISGTTAVSTTTTINLTLDSTGLLPILYTANLCIASNDPLQPEVNVPVTLQVTGDPPPPIPTSPPPTATPPPPNFGIYLPVIVKEG
ncbi:MAG: VCBS repeat-containing protein [Anaerolineae bacterium]|nr:VCBS repeat-containing protein [Anaerolineae bacterium]